jgi:hypothetical protein
VVNKPVSLIDPRSIRKIDDEALLVSDGLGRRWIGPATIGLACIELGLALAVVWTDFIDETLNRCLGISAALLAALVHACLTLGRLRGDDGRVVRWLTAAAVACSTSCAVLIAGALGLVTHSVGSGWGYWRLRGVLAVLGTLCTLLAPLARRFRRRGPLNPSGPPGTPQPCSTSCA